MSSETTPSGEMMTQPWISRRNRIVLANGCFDIFHYGHLLHLEAAKKMGSLLVVSITDDEHVNKGPGRPFFTETERAELVKKIVYVDDVVIVSSLIEALEIIKPDILVKGQDYEKGMESVHMEYCHKHGIHIAFTDTPKYSAKKIIDESRRH